jgi:sugar lactone lactonase YvrE
MRLALGLLSLAASVSAFAHPGGGIVALDANTVIAADPTGNAIWRFQKGKKPERLVTKFHGHWVTRGLDGHIYIEAMQESGGAWSSAAFRLDPKSGKPVEVAHRDELKSLLFAVDRDGSFVFPRDGRLVTRALDGKVAPFRGHGTAAKLELPFHEVTAMAWGPDQTLYSADGTVIRRFDLSGSASLVARIEGTPISATFYGAANKPRIWGLAVDDKKRVFAAVPDLGQVLRIDTDGTKDVIATRTDGWRATGVTTLGSSVFMLESNEANYDGPRVRVLRGDGSIEILGIAGQ